MCWRARSRPPTSTPSYPGLQGLRGTVQPFPPSLLSSSPNASPHPRYTALRPGHKRREELPRGGGASNRLAPVFVRGHLQKDVIEAGRPVSIPNAYYGFRLETGPPAGRGRVFAIVTEDPISLDDLLDADRDLRPVADAKSWLLSLGERLREPWLGEAGTREARWSAARVEYEIVP